MKSFYDILEVSPSADSAEIRASYLKLAREYHPDRVPEHLTKLHADAEEKVKQINEAWAVLSDPAKRKTYDLKLYSGAAAGGFQPSAAPNLNYRAATNPRGTPLDWLRTRKDVVRWTLLVAVVTLMLVVIGELIVFRGTKTQSHAANTGLAVATGDLGVYVRRYDFKPVQFRTSQFAGRTTLSIQLVSVGLSASQTILNFRVLGGERSGFLLYEPPGASVRKRLILGRSVAVDRGLEEPYLLDDSGPKYYSTSGLIGGAQANFDLYNYTRRINFKPHETVMLSAEFPPLDNSTSSVTFVLPALADWQPEWRWPGINLK